MILRIDHVGVVAHSLEQGRSVLLDTLGFTFDTKRTAMPDGNFMAHENCRIYFVQVGDGETQIELLLPQDSVTGMGKWLAKRGPSVHHLCYLVDDVPTHAAELRGKGLEQIDLGPNSGAAFFYPRSTMGILTELVDRKTTDRVHSPGGPATTSPVR